MKSRSKYGSVRTEIDGIIFHSKGEARRWQELKLLERAGEIAGLHRQSKFPLAVHHVLRNRHEVIGYYIADFSYMENGVYTVEEFKGAWTPLAKWKIAHFEAQEGIKVLVTGRAQRRQRGR